MTTDTVSSDTLQFALYYAETMKWNVFPVPPGTKMGYSEFAVEHTGRRWGATNDPAEVRRMFELRPEANIGIVCGEVSGIFALDIDTLVGHGKDGFAELAALEAEHGKLQATMQDESPTGSRHDLFKHPGSDFYITSTANKIGLGIDVKGDGGMIIAAPSVTAKGVYRWRNQLPIVDAPEWLLNLVTRKITDEEKRIVKHAPPNDEPTQPPAEIAKLERFVLLALGKNLEWFEDREHALHTVWGIKRAGYGREGYRIADLICSHDAFPETQRVERVNRFWNDRGANKGTVSLASFWKMCADIGIKQTPAEIAAWKNEESRRLFDEIAVKIVAEGEAPLQPGMQNDTPKAKPLRVISAASFAGRPAPEREDLVAGLIPAKIIGGLYGDGAVGKSLLAMMLGVSVTTGRPWLNRIVRKGPVVYVCCEDDEAEVHRRLENICREMGVDMAALSDFHIVPLADEESVLAGSDGRSSVLATTPLYAQLLELTKDVKPQLLI